jgi:hypothetical protein
MSTQLAPYDDDMGPFSRRQQAAAQRSQASTELELYRYFLEARAVADRDRFDTQAVADATRCALGEEIGLLDFGLAQAGQSAAKLALVARHVERLANINDRRISRRFGG